MSSLRDAWAAELVELAEHDDRILLLDADLATSTRADRFAAAYPDRFVQGGIAEQNLVGMAAGLADHGYVPWLSSFAVFFTHRALDPLRMLVAQTGANVKVAAAYAGVLTGSTGKTHQDVQDLAIMRAMPGMTVLCPADEHECRAMVRWANEHDGPVYLRLARDDADSLAGASEFRPGVVRVLRRPTDVVVVSTGVQTTRCLAAVELLEAQGFRAGLVHVPTLKPLDDHTLAESLGAARLVVSVEEHTILGGLGGAVAEALASHGSSAVLRRIGIADHWGESAPNDDLLERYGLSATAVARTVLDAVNTHTTLEGQRS